MPLIKTAALLAECLAEVRQIGDVALLHYMINADRSRVNWLNARPRAISYRAALCGDQGSAHAAACGR